MKPPSNLQCTGPNFEAVGHDDSDNLKDLQRKLRKLSSSWLIAAKRTKNLIPVPFVEVGNFIHGDHHPAPPLRDVQLVHVRFFDGELKDELGLGRVEQVILKEFNRLI